MFVLRAEHEAVGDDRVMTPEQFGQFHTAARTLELIVLRKAARRQRPALRGDPLDLLAQRDFLPKQRIACRAIFRALARKAQIVQRFCLGSCLRVALSWRVEISCEPVQGFAPAPLMGIAGSLVGELFVEQREQRAFAVRLADDRHQRLALRRRPPGPGEHQLLVRHHFAEHSPDSVLLTVRRSEEDVEASANARIRFRIEHHGARRTPPAQKLLRIGPGTVDPGGAGVEPPFQREARFGSRH